MPWLKRNLWLVLGAVISLGVIGFGGWHWLNAVSKNEEVSEQIEKAKHDLEELMNSTTYPSSSNIARARIELQRVNAFIIEAKKQFPAAPAPSAPLNNQTFKALLQTTVDDLAKEASSVGTRIETNYYFSFESQRLPMTFAPESLRPLSDRLTEVQTISSLLFKAKINRLESVRRAHVPGEPAGGADYLTEAPRPNAELGMMIWPYEFTFHSFSPELAAVMENIMRIPDAIIIRSVVVEPAEALAVVRPGPQVAGGPTRRGVPAAPKPAASLETLLNERALRVVMKLDVIKPESFGDRPGGPGGRGGFGRPPGAP